MWCPGLDSKTEKGPCGKAGDARVRIGSSAASRCPGASFLGAAQQ